MNVKRLRKTTQQTLGKLIPIYYIQVDKFNNFKKYVNTKQLMTIIFIKLMRLYAVVGPRKPGTASWREEVKRMTWHVPSVCMATVCQHKHQVLDVSFSNRGDMFCTSSKDAHVIVRNKNVLVFMFFTKWKLAVKFHYSILIFFRK